MKRLINTIKANRGLAAGIAFLALSFGGYVWLSSRTESPAVQALPIQHNKPDSGALMNTELQRLRQAASSEFLNLAQAHESEANARLSAVVRACIDRSRSRVDAYADRLLSYETSFVIAKAWWNGSMDSEITRLTQKNLISEKELNTALGAEGHRLHRELANKADVISANYEDRVATVLAQFDSATVAATPELAQFTVLTNRMKTTILVGNAAGMSSFVGTTLVLGPFLETKFIAWLGEKIAIKVGSKVIRVGTGPIGWVVGLTAGVAAEWAADKYLLKPRIGSELNLQLDNLQAELHRNGGPAHQIASSQAGLARQIAKELGEPQKTLASY